MLSVQFLPRGTEASDWYAAGMTADGVRHTVAGAWGSTAGSVMWYGTLLCGFLVLAPDDVHQCRRGDSPLGRRDLDLEPPAAQAGTPAASASSTSAC